MRAVKVPQQPLATAAVWLLCCGLPVAWVPLTTDPVTPLRFVILGLALAAALWSAPRGRLDASVGWALGACLVVAACAAFAGKTPLLSLIGRFPRYEGLPVLAGYALALVAGARLLSDRSANLRSAAMTALTVGVLANATVAVFQLIADPSQRPQGLVGNASILGALGVLSVAMLGLQALVRRKAWWIAGAVAGAICVVTSASRGALLGLVVALVSTLIWRLRVRPRAPWWPLPAAAVAVTAVMLALPTSGPRLSGTSPFAESTITGRWLLWQEAWRLLVDHPWLGVGPSRFVDSIGFYHTPAWAASVGPYAPPDSPHTLALQVLVSTGILGLAAALAGVVLAGRALWLQRDWDAWQADAVALVVGLGAVYSTAFTDPVTTPLAAFLVGGALANQAPGRIPARVAHWAAIAPALAGVVLGVSGLAAESAYSDALAASQPAAQVRRAIAWRPWDADLARRAGYSLVRLYETGHGEASDAEVLLAETCPRLPGSVECLLPLADAQDYNQDTAGALATLDGALLLDPNNVDTWLRRGIALANLKRYGDAEAAFLKAVSLRPTAPEPWTDLAQLYQLQGRTAESQQAKDKAASLTRR
jgi:O-antigen ligase